MMHTVFSYSGNESNGFGGFELPVFVRAEFAEGGKSSVDMHRLTVASTPFLRSDELLREESSSVLITPSAFLTVAVTGVLLTVADEVSVSEVSLLSGAADAEVRMSAAVTGCLSPLERTTHSGPSFVAHCCQEPGVFTDSVALQLGVTINTWVD